MELTEPYASIKNILNRAEGISLLQHIEAIARVSHRSEERVVSNSWQKFIESVVLHKGDWSVVEHSSITVEAVVDRGITHEWVRHRLGAYTQESTRFVNYTKGHVPKFIRPLDIDPGTTEYAIWSQAVDTCLLVYRDLLGRSIPPQIARSILPMCLASKMIVTYNLRVWRHFFLMRTTKETHPQFKQVTVPLLQSFKNKIPLLYDDIEPEARQIDNMKKAH